jgi:Spy/CpxP family protein refolding chaperone
MFKWRTCLLLVLAVCVGATFPAKGFSQRVDEKPTASEHALRLYVMLASSMPSVQKELKLTDEQLATMAEVRQRVVEARALTDENEKVYAVLAKVAKMIQDVLSVEQQQRLRQIRLQGLGILALRLPEIVATLEITGEQQEKLREIVARSMEKVRALNKNIDMPLPELKAKRRKQHEESMRDALALLTPSQRVKFEKLKGAKFDLSAEVPPAKGYGGRKSDTAPKKK